MSSRVYNNEEALVEAGFLAPSQTKKAYELRQDRFFKQLASINSEKLSDRDKARLEDIRRQKAKLDEDEEAYYERRKQDAIREAEEARQSIGEYKQKAVNLLSAYGKYQKHRDYEREKKRKETEELLEGESRRALYDIKQNEVSRDGFNERMREREKRKIIRSATRLGSHD
jgi:hypothetical protein